MPDGVTSLENPRACTGHRIEPLFSLEGPISGGMITLTIRHALLDDVVKSFGPELPLEGHVVPGTEELTVLMMMDSIPSLIADLVASYTTLLEATQNPSE